MVPYKQQEYEEHSSQDGNDLQRLAEKLPFALWGYRTSICASTRATPYSLVYGSEAVLPIEVEIQSLRVLVETKVLEED